MKRDLKKAIQDYRKRFRSGGDVDGAFYGSDLCQIKDISSGYVDSVFNSLEAGFMIGYRKAQRDYRNQSKKISALTPEQRERLQIFLEVVLIHKAGKASEADVMSYIMDLPQEDIQPFASIMKSMQ